MTEEFFDFRLGGMGMLTADAFASDVAGQFVQVKGNGQALLAGHGTVTFDLSGQCVLRIHDSNVAG